MCSSLFALLHGIFIGWVRCDDIDPFTNTVKDLTVSRGTYAHAQKLRAAISHHFRRTLELGTQVWTESSVHPGKYVGNPSLSITVSQYMVSLHRRKVRSGEVVTSARAIDEPILKLLYEFNTQIPRDDPDAEPMSKKRKAEHPEHWAGSGIRAQLQLLYILAFLCLLRFDEALRIQWHWVSVETYQGMRRLKIELPFRKTHQTGGTILISF
ncbi:hypothetical protein ARMSODRAFT_895720 [Armillaria solidipes]|uniref:Tyr recombinase domain-containing protein n=1 Tax=Armillaria solidipes TaxID=1076256 RepID=A0A2H3AUD8_9AGAR|nr:hypothetical protein ARMSODRAFT_895720 [Armillaria solidipes]